jgi:CheY-like chemotaxis protein
LKHDLHCTEPIRAIEPPDQEVVLANASGEVPLQEELKPFQMKNVWGQLSLTPGHQTCGRALIWPHFDHYIWPHPKADKFPSLHMVWKGGLERSGSAKLFSGWFDSIPAPPSLQRGSKGSGPHCCCATRSRLEITCAPSPATLLGGLKPGDVLADRTTPLPAGSIPSSGLRRLSDTLPQMPPQGVTILIGEDDELIAADMQHQLRGLGYQVVIRAGTPKEVVFWAHEQKPSLIVLDMNITGDMHGLEVAREIHSIANIPIVFVSAYAADVSENDSVIPRPYRYVTKPFILSQLHAAIEELLAL